MGVEDHGRIMECLGNDDSHHLDILLNNPTDISGRWTAFEGVGDVFVNVLEGAYPHGRDVESLRLFREIVGMLVTLVTCSSAVNGCTWHTQ